MHFPLLPAVLLSACLLAQGAFAPHALAAGKESAPAAGKAEDSAALAKAMDLMPPAGITCPPNTTLRIPMAGKLVDAELGELTRAGVAYNGKDGAGRLAWPAIASALTAADILKKAVDPKNPGHALWAARMLLNVKGGAPLAEAYFRQAGALDKSLDTPALREAVAEMAIADYNASKPAWAWPHLNQADAKEALRLLDTHVRDNAKKAGLTFISDQSEHFVLYTDADLREARPWAGKLEKTYAGMCKIFQLDPRQTIWQGKCAVILCRNQASYGKWMAAIEPGNKMAAASAGLSVSNAAFEGSASIQFHLGDARTAQTEAILYHELAHAFTAQFHGNESPASWVSEGLAEYIATDGKGFESKIQESQQAIKRSGSMEDFFAAKNIRFKHYGAAFQITSLLLKKSPAGYGPFLKACTEGVEPEEALKTHCGMTLEQLTAAYGRMLTMTKLRSH